MMQTVLKTHYDDNFKYKARDMHNFKSIMLLF